MTGKPVPVVEGVRRSIGGATGVTQYSLSSAGSLVFVSGPVTGSAAQRDVALVDRSGTALPLKLPPGSYRHPRMSPDGKQLAVDSNDGKGDNVWIYDLSGASAIRRLTFEGQNRFPAWSADSQRVAFQSDREGDLGIFWQRADGTGTGGAADAGRGGRRAHS